MTIPTLEQSASRLSIVDDMILRLVRTRMSIAGDVAAFKEITGEPIFRPSIEDDRIEKIRGVAIEIGLNPHFAETILYLLIGESCKLQMIQLQDANDDHHLPEDLDDRFNVFRRNLIDLTKAVANTYQKSGSDKYPATAMYLEFEQNQILRHIKGLTERTVALDLGCGAGRVASLLGDHFDSVIGFDLSQHMVAKAANAGYKE